MELKPNEWENRCRLFAATAISRVETWFVAREIRDGKPNRIHFFVFINPFPVATGICTYDPFGAVLNCIAGFSFSKRRRACSLYVVCPNAGSTNSHANKATSRARSSWILLSVLSHLSIGGLRAVLLSLDGQFLLRSHLVSADTAKGPDSTDGCHEGC